MYTLYFITVIFLHCRPRLDNRTRSFCYTSDSIKYSTGILIYIPLTLIFLLNFQILNVSRKQRKRILKQSVVTGINNCNEKSGRTRVVLRLFHAFTEARTFSIVITVLVISCVLPTVITVVLESHCSDSCRQVWFVIVQYELYRINSIVNAFIYGMRHIKYRKAYGQILFRILDFSSCC